MPSLKHLRSRVKSVKETQKVTKAMQIVSANELKKVQRAFARNTEFNLSVTRIVHSILCDDTLISELSPQNYKIVHDKKSCQNHLIIVFSSDRGLCGSYNASILRTLASDITLAKNQEIKLIVVGKKGFNVLKHYKKADIILNYESCFRSGINMSRSIADKLLNLIQSDEVDKCTVYFNDFKSVMTQIPKSKQIWPIIFEKSDDDSSQLFNIEGKDVYEDIFKRYFIGKIYNLFLVSQVSEYASRMTAMDGASRNATKVIDKLVLQLNRIRQAIVTTELMEIIAGSGEI